VDIVDKDLIELGKKNAAFRAVEENVKKNMILGIGSGSTFGQLKKMLKKT